MTGTLEALDRSECLRLMGTKSIGRLGLTVGALPTVMPVNFRLIGERLFLRTSCGTKLCHATDSAVVAFEVDHIDEESETGWTVVVTGIAEPVHHRDIEERLEAMGIPNWSPKPMRRIVAISTDVISGRRLFRTAAELAS